MNKDDLLELFIAIFEVLWSTITIIGYTFSVILLFWLIIEVLSR